MMRAFYFSLFLLLLNCVIITHADHFNYKDYSKLKPLEEASFKDLDDGFKPEQVHLSLGLNSSEIIVTWATLREVPRSFIEYRILKYNQAYGPIFKYDNVERTDWISHHENNITRKHYTYRGKMINLIVDHLYEYRISSSINSNNESDLIRGDTFIFKVNDIQTPRSKTSNLIDSKHSNIKVAIYGDLGLINGQSIKQLYSMAKFNKIQLIIHNGDFAYDLDRYTGIQGDKFMDLIEKISAIIPYQTSVGNHEIKEKFLHYNQRFTMIDSGQSNFQGERGKRNNFFYSFNVGPIHFISISTEFYYFLDYLGPIQLSEQYSYLERELKFANSKAERELRPWIIVFGHRPMYCSSTDEDDCTKRGDILRTGLPFIGSFGLEKLFYENSVDLLFWSHEHQYERFLPLYDNQVMNGTDKIDDPYYNPKGPVHVISGSAGCEEKIDNFKTKLAPGSQVRISDYGFGILTATKSSLNYEQLLDHNQIIVDSFVITKTNTKNFP